MIVDVFGAVYWDDFPIERLPEYTLEEGALKDGTLVKLLKNNTILANPISKANVYKGGQCLVKAGERFVARFVFETANESRNVFKRIVGGFTPLSAYPKALQPSDYADRL